MHAEIFWGIFSAYVGYTPLRVLLFAHVRTMEYASGTSSTGGETRLIAQHVTSDLDLPRTIPCHFISDEPLRFNKAYFCLMNTGLCGVAE